LIKLPLTAVDFSLLLSFQRVKLVFETMGATKKLLDKFFQPPYHSTEAIIYLQSVQIK